jgi:hypothetical protein
MGRNPKYVNEFDYYLQKIDIQSPTQCWNWVGSVKDCGHGMWGYKSYWNGTKIASRETYRLFKGDPKDMFVCHSCGNPRCCNPNHLYLGTAKQNQMDRVKHNTSNRGSRCGTAKLNEDQVIHIKKLIKNKVKLIDIAIKFGVSESTVKAIKQNRNWAHLKPD